MTVSTPNSAGAQLQLRQRGDEVGVRQHLRAAQRVAEIALQRLHVDRGGPRLPARAVARAAARSAARLRASRMAEPLEQLLRAAAAP